MNSHFKGYYLNSIEYFQENHSKDLNGISKNKFYEGFKEFYNRDIYYEGFYSCTAFKQNYCHLQKKVNIFKLKFLV